MNRACDLITVLWGRIAGARPEGANRGRDDMRFPPAAGVLLAGCMATAAAQSDRAIDLSSGVPFHLVEPTAPFTVTYEVGGATHSLEEYFERNFVTGFLVLRDSAILVERY